MSQFKVGDLVKIRNGAPFAGQIGPITGFESGGPAHNLYPVLVALGGTKTLAHSAHFNEVELDLYERPYVTTDDITSKLTAEEYQERVELARKLRREMMAPKPTPEARVAPTPQSVAVEAAPGVPVAFELNVAVATKPQVDILAHALFRARMHEDICRHAELEPSFEPTKSMAPVDVRYRRVASVMWERETKVRAECLEQARQMVKVWP